MGRTILDNQHKQIKGYRDLSQDEIDLMNKIKSVGEILDNLTKKVMQHDCDLYNEHGYEDYTKIYGSLDCNLGWVESATHDLQVGLMKLTRAVAKPTTF